jgi:hypothetical protein
MELLTPQEQEIFKADAYNRFMQERGISRALTPEEKVQALNAAGQKPSGAPTPQPEPGFPENVRDIGAIYAAPTFSEKMAEAQRRVLSIPGAVAEGTFKGLGDIGRSIGRGTILPTTDLFGTVRSNAQNVADIEQGAPSALGQAGQTVSGLVQAAVSPIQTAENIITAFSNPEMVRQMLAGTLDIGKRTREGDWLGMLMDIPFRGLLREGADVAPPQLTRQTPDAERVAPKTHHPNWKQLPEHFQNILLKEARDILARQGVNLPKIIQEKFPWLSGIGPGIRSGAEGVGIGLLDVLANVGLGSKGGAKEVYRGLEKAQKTPEGAEIVRRVQAGEGSLREDIKIRVDDHMHQKLIDSNDVYGERLKKIIEGTGGMEQVDVPRLVKQVRNELEDSFNVILKPQRKEYRPDRTLTEIHSDLFEQPPKYPAFGDFPSLVTGDEQIVRKIVDEMNRLEASGGTVKDVHSSFQRIKSLSESPDIGMASFGDKILAKTVDQIGEVLGDASDPLKELNNSHKKIRDNISDLQEQFSITGSESAENLFKKLTEPFEAKGITVNDKLELIKQLDSEMNGTLLPWVLGEMTRPRTGKGWQSKALQAGAVLGGVLGTVYLPVPATGLAVLVFGAGASPRSISFVSRLLGKEQYKKFLGKLEELRGSAVLSGVPKTVGTVERARQREENRSLEDLLGISSRGSRPFQE